MKLDIKKPVKLVNPQEGEEKLVFRVTNYNEETKRCHIQEINSSLTFPPNELVRVEDIINI